MTTSIDSLQGLRVRLRKIESLTASLEAQRAVKEAEVKSLRGELQELGFSTDPEKALKQINSKKVLLQEELEEIEHRLTV